MTVIFWQNCISIHQHPLLAELNNLGVKVIQIVEEMVPAQRAKMGWSIPQAEYEVHEFGAINLEQILANNSDAYHVFSGFHGFKAVGATLKKIYARFPERCYVFQERPDLRGFKGLLRRLIYRWYCYKYRKIGGILAAGSVAFFKGVTNKIPIHAFPYYVYSPRMNVMEENSTVSNSDLVRFAFVGSLFPIKNITGMCKAFGAVRVEWKLSIAGSGEELVHILDLQKRRPDCHVSILGYIDNTKIGSLLYHSDCLVLPSWKDGYGAVVNEAALAGLRIICSEAAGGAERLKDLPVTNWYFDPHKPATFEQCIEEVASLGSVGKFERAQRIAAARELLPAEGAKYLLEILSCNVKAD